MLVVPVGLPGTWVLIALAVAFEFADDAWLPGAGGVTFGWSVLGLCGGLPPDAGVAPDHTVRLIRELLDR